MQIKVEDFGVALIPNWWDFGSPPETLRPWTQPPTSAALCTWHVLCRNRSPKLSFRLTWNPLFAYFFSRSLGRPQINFSIAHSDVGRGGGCDSGGRIRRWRSPDGRLRHQPRWEQRPIIVGDRILQPGSSVLAPARGIRPFGVNRTGGAVSGWLRHLQCDDSDRNTCVSALSGKCFMPSYPQTLTTTTTSYPRQAN